MLRKAWVELLCLCCRSRQPHIPSEGPDHSHQGPEAKASSPGGATGALPVGAQEALHQGGSEWILDFCFEKLWETLWKLQMKNLCWSWLLSLSSQELTGKLPSDYPLMPDENPPHIRQRIGASFKLDERLIQQDKEVEATVSFYYPVSFLVKVGEQQRKHTGWN